ncbi:hypothetical protein ACH4GE_33125 [Streptomyces tendae]|uniref:hypothetical protein n=1 Tax=Streptomyces tendae TaxID=1932 RepID=UPI0037A0CD7B
MAGITGPPGMSGAPGTDSAGSAPPDRSGGGFRAVAFDAGAFAAVAFFLVGLVFFASAISHSLNQVLDLEAILCRTRFPRPADTPKLSKVVLARIKPTTSPERAAVPLDQTEVARPCFQRHKFALARSHSCPRTPAWTASCMILRRDRTAHFICSGG